MDVELASQKIEAYLKETFGKVVTLRELSVERRSSGRVWMGTAYCVTQRGDLEIGKIGVTESGEILGDLGVDELVAALISLGRFDSSPAIGSSFSASSDMDFSGLGSSDGERDEREPAHLSEVFEEEEEKLDNFFQELDGSSLRGRIIGLLTSGGDAELQEARRLLPKLLTEHGSRGDVLRQMGELEFRLGNTGLGLDYLEAASREFADLADVDALTQIVSLASRVLSPEELEGHALKALLEQTMARRKPIATLGEVPAFQGLGKTEMDRLSEQGGVIRLAKGETLLREGDEAVWVFVVLSGALAVELETPGGDSRVVRCCLPGELVGESSVLEVAAPTCNATVSAREAATLWRFRGEDLKGLMGKVSDLRARIEAKRTLHRLDSFFSMNEATGTLDGRVRDKLLGCISAIRHVRAGEVLERSGELPSAIYLLVTGQIEYQRPGQSPRVYGPDQFVCIKDTLHELPLEGVVVATQPCRLVTFDPDQLRKLAAEAPLEVVAVLERLE